MGASFPTPAHPFSRITTGNGPPPPGSYKVAETDFVFASETGTSTDVPLTGGPLAQAIRNRGSTRVMVRFCISLLLLFVGDGNRGAAFRSPTLPRRQLRCSGRWTPVGQV